MVINDDDRVNIAIKMAEQSSEHKNYLSMVCEHQEIDYKGSWLFDDNASLQYKISNERK